MSARGYPEGRSIQAPGMMRHGPAPTLAPLIRQPIDPPLPPPEILENNLAVQGAEMDKLLRENHRLAATHAALRHELLAAQQEMQKVQARAAEVQAESSAQLRGIMDKVLKMEADVKAGESVKKDLQQAHVEAQGLVAARMDLSAQIEQATDELQRMHSNIKKLPELHAEIDGLMQEHQKLRATFEREKGGNMELVQKMHAMEKNLVSMAREVEKLRNEVQDAEKRAQTPTPNPYQSPYGTTDHSRNPSQDASYGQSRNPGPDAGYGQSRNPGQDAGYGQSRNPGQDVGYGQSRNPGQDAGYGQSRNPGQDAGYNQGGAYAAGIYGQGDATYANGGYGQATLGGHSDPYGRTAQVQMMGNIDEKLYSTGAGEKANPYGSSLTNAAYNTAQGAAVGGYNSGMGGAASFGTGGYDYARSSAVGGSYDPSRGATNAYEAARGAAAGGSAIRPGEDVYGSYNTSAMGAANVYGMYEAARATQMPMQR